ncbi:hypothetical protein Hanom_Chr03g00209971 [Helianthus anomalus]
MEICIYEIQYIWNEVGVGQWCFTGGVGGNERIVAAMLVEKEGVFLRQEETPTLGGGASPEKKTKWWGGRWVVVVW